MAWSTGGVRSWPWIGASVVALLVSAAPAAADSLRLETITEGGVTGARMVYIGDERNNRVVISLARNEDIDYQAPHPLKVVGFLVTGASDGPACELTGGIEGEQLCRVSDGVRLLPARAYGLAGRDSITIYVPRRDAVIYGGPGDDSLAGPYGADGETLLPGELHGGPGKDVLEGNGLLYGGPGDDDLSWEPVGPSRILGGPGDDVIWGSERADVIDAGPGHDEVLAWGGNDTIRTADGQSDVVTCDDGRDSLTADGRDEPDFSASDHPFGDCERLDRRGEPLLSPFRFQEWAYERYVTVLYGCPPDGPSLCIGTCSLRRGGRLIARRRLRERAGTWGVVYFRLGSRRIHTLLDKDIRITIRWRDRAGHMRSLKRTDRFYEPDYDDN